MVKIENDDIKFVLLIWYSDTRIVSQKIKLIFNLENWLWILEMPNGSASIVLKDIKKSFEYVYFCMKFY